MLWPTEEVLRLSFNDAWQIRERRDASTSNFFR